MEGATVLASEEAEESSLPFASALAPVLLTLDGVAAAEAPSLLSASPLAPVVLTLDGVAPATLPASEADELSLPFASALAPVEVEGVVTAAEVLSLSLASALAPVTLDGVAAAGLPSLLLASVASELPPARAAAAEELSAIGQIVVVIVT